MNVETTLRARCVEFLRVRGLLHPGSRYLLAVSGGVDSMTLMHLFGGLAPAWQLALTAMYVDHGLRAASESESRFVAEAAAGMGIGLLSRRVDVRAACDASGDSVQAAARRLRYDALEKARAAVDADLILTAHHADDQAETILLHVLKGAGVHGCSGIRPVLGRVARPLLGVSRAEIAEYAACAGVCWREDASNETDDYLRNALRHHVIPAIREHINPGISSTLGRTAALFYEMEEYLDAWLSSVSVEAIIESDGGVSLAVLGRKEYFHFQQYALIREAILRCRSTAASFEETVAVQRLLDRTPGSCVDLRGGCIATREREVIRLERQAGGVSMEELPFHPGETVRFGAVEVACHAVALSDARFDRDSAVEYVDADASGEALFLRCWRAGDRMMPLGFQHWKNVSDVLTNQHTASHRKRNLPVVTNGDNIIWVCGVRLDDRFKITPRTRRALRLSIRHIDSDQ